MILEGSYHKARMKIPKPPTARAPILLTVTSRPTAPLIEPPLSSLLPLPLELEPPEKLDVLIVELPLLVEVAVELVSSDESRPEPPELEQLELEPCEIRQRVLSQSVVGLLTEQHFPTTSEHVSPLSQ